MACYPATGCVRPGKARRATCQSDEAGRAAGRPHDPGRSYNADQPRQGEAAGDDGWRSRDSGSRDSGRSSGRTREHRDETARAECRPSYRGGDRGTRRSRSYPGGDCETRRSRSYPRGDCETRRSGSYPGGDCETRETRRSRHYPRGHRETRRSRSANKPHAELGRPTGPSPAPPVGIPAVLRRTDPGPLPGARHSQRLGDRSVPDRCHWKRGRHGEPLFRGRSARPVLAAGSDVQPAAPLLRRAAE
jgi:hypothetical protein